eukprot:922074-Prymnesium_polylepis.1
MVGASKWDTVHGQTLRCEGLREYLRSGVRVPGGHVNRCLRFTSLRSRLGYSPAWATSTGLTL